MTRCMRCCHRSSRLVLVLDEAPADLVRLVGYLEAKTDGLIIDLITVSAHEIGGSRVIVPTRIEPARDIGETKKRLPAAASTGSVSTGADDFRASIAMAPAENQQALVRLCDWAEELAGIGPRRWASSTKHESLRAEKS